MVGVEVVVEEEVDEAVMGEVRGQIWSWHGWCTGAQSSCSAHLHINVLTL